MRDWLAAFGRRCYLALCGALPETASRGRCARLFRGRGVEMRVIVTGGAGFIGSAVCRHFVLDLGHDVVVVGKLTYAGNMDSLGLLLQIEVLVREARHLSMPMR